MSENQKLHNFEMAQKNLEYVFSSYQRGNLEGCPCCVSNEDIEAVYRGEFGRYLGKAMTTCGTEDDFKYFLPQIFIFVYKDLSYLFWLKCKLDYVPSWTEEEQLAISSWFDAFVEYKYIGEFEEAINKSRLQAQDWLRNPTENLACELPLSVFENIRFGEVKVFLSPKQLNKLNNLLNLWPEYEIDFLVLASSDNLYFALEIFDKKAVFNWLVKYEKVLEEIFFKLSNVLLEKLFSEGIERLRCAQLCFTE